MVPFFEEDNIEEINAVVEEESKHSIAVRECVDTVSLPEDINCMKSDNPEVSLFEMYW